MTDQTAIESRVIPINLPSTILTDDMLDDGQKVTLAALYACADSTGAYLAGQNARIAGITGKSPRTVGRHLAELVDSGRWLRSCVDHGAPVLQLTTRPDGSSFVSSPAKGGRRR